MILTEQDSVTRAMIARQYEIYPHMEIRDLFKFLHQSAFGCEHLVSSLEAAVNWIKKEAAQLESNARSEIEPLDGEYSRLHLGILGNGMKAETLGKIFYLSSRTESNGQSELKKKLRVAESMIKEGLLHFDIDEFLSFWDQWEEKEYAAIHHSDKFRVEYSPAYRVISNKFIPLIPFLCVIDAGNMEKEDAFYTLSSDDDPELTSLLETIYCDK